MKIKHTAGFSHILLPLIIVVLTATVGTFLVVRSHADETATAAGAHFHRLKGKDLKRAKRIAWEFWGKRACGPGGRDIHLVWYDNRKYFQHFLNPADIAKSYTDDERKYGHVWVAFDYDGSGLSRHTKNYCKIFMNSQAISWAYRHRAHPYNRLNSGQYECELITHEEGHLTGYRSKHGYHGWDHYHSNSTASIMYGGGVTNSIQIGTAGAPRCRAEF